MASKAVLVLFLFLIAISTVAIAQRRDSNLTLGSSLSPTANSSLLSPSGLFAFGFIPISTNVYDIAIWYAGLPQQTIIWTANRNDPRASMNDTLVLTTDGRLMWRNSKTRQEKSITNGYITGSVALVSLLDSGNLVLFNSERKIIWQSFENPTNTLLPGQLLRAPNELVSSISENNNAIGKYRIKMQNDGNIVMYPIGSLDERPFAYWAASSNFVGSNATLALDETGRLYMLNSTGATVNNVTNGGSPDASNRRIYRATIDADGLFRLYSHNISRSGSWSFEWSIPNNRCDPKGICGFNGYCILMDLQPTCACPPGFVFVDMDDKSLGCVLNFTAESCVYKNSIVNYNIRKLENTLWEDAAYSFLSLIEEEDCEQACLEDCNCEAALYMDQVCKKQKLPLRFGKRVVDESVVAFVKVGDGGFTSSAKERKKGQPVKILIIGVTCISFAMIILLFSVFLVCRNSFRSHKEVPSETMDGTLMVEEAFTLRSFNYSELETATNGFVEILGRGSFGTVFKGATQNGQRTIAVKRLEKIAADGEVEFRNEMRSIGRTHHRNLLRLLGYCHEGSNRLLVYDYMSNGSLAKFLFESSVRQNWEERMRITLGIAKGIRYLHEECENQIIHCDINPNNILIDENHTAKIADFGLAKLLMPDQTRTTTEIRGTRGFVAPEWHKNLPITAKADVYSFGVVLLVIICCRPNVDVNVPERKAILIEWVYQCYKANELTKLVKDEEVKWQEFERMLRIGLWCIQEEPAIRPAMKKVVSMFEGNGDIPAPPDLSSYSNA